MRSILGFVATAAVSAMFLTSAHAATCGSTNGNSDQVTVIVSGTDAICSTLNGPYVAPAGLLDLTSTNLSITPPPPYSIDTTGVDFTIKPISGTNTYDNFELVFNNDNGSPTPDSFYFTFPGGQLIGTFSLLFGGNTQTTDVFLYGLLKSSAGVVPLPGALPLLGSVLGAAFLLSTWRRKRRGIAPRWQLPYDIATA